MFQEIYGFKRSVVRTGLTWVLIVATAGLLRLFFHWLPEYMLRATHTPCPLSCASKVLIVVSNIVHCCTVLLNTLIVMIVQYMHEM